MLQIHRSAGGLHTGPLASPVWTVASLSHSVPPLPPPTRRWPNGSEQTDALPPLKELSREFAESVDVSGFPPNRLPPHDIGVIKGGLGVLCISPLLDGGERSRTDLLVSSHFAAAFRGESRHCLPFLPPEWATRYIWL